MADLFTIVECGPNNTGGYMCNGRLGRAEAIGEARRFWERELEHARRRLSTPDEQFSVRVVRGVHVQRLVEELKP